MKKSIGSFNKGPKRYLLDTHAFLWMFSLPGKLSRRVRKIVENDESELFLSVAAIWELGLKHALGKLELPLSPREYVLRRSREARVELLPILPRHTFRVIELDLLHRDPFDRMMVAQVLEEEMVAVTNDPVFSQYGVSCVW